MPKIKIETERVVCSSLGSDATEIAIQEHVQQRANDGWTLRAIATMPVEGFMGRAVLCLVYAKKVRTDV